MQYKNIFSFDMKWNYRTTVMFAVLLLLPNLLGIINITTGYGFKIHFFQVAIFIAALLYGPTGGMLSGILGSAYSSIIIGNPYIAVGNAILGYMVGIFTRYGFQTVIAVILGFAVQLLWLVPTDLFLMDMPIEVLIMLITALFASNIVWAIAADYSAKRLKKVLV
jgi:uncharacterized membrane protein